MFNGRRSSFQDARAALSNGMYLAGKSVCTAPMLLALQAFAQRNRNRAGHRSPVNRANSRASKQVSSDLMLSPILYLWVEPYGSLLRYASSNQLQPLWVSVTAHACACLTCASRIPTRIRQGGYH